jgi:hypothetical protein
MTFIKSIYVSGYEKQRHHSKWRYIGVLVLAVFLGILTVASPFIAASWINKKGADGKGDHFRVAEVSMNIFRGEINLRDLKVFNPENLTVFAEAPVLAINFQWADFFRRNYIFDLKANQLNLIFSKALFDEIQRMKYHQLSE